MSGKHLSEATNGPTYKTAIQNGLSVARFDGTNDLLSSTITLVGPAQTFFVVAMKRSAIGTAAQVLATFGAAQAEIYTDTDVGTGWSWYAKGAGGTQALNVGTPTAASVIVLAQTSFSLLDFYFNGSTATYLGFDPDNTLGGTTAFTFSGGGLGFGDFDVMETLHYNSRLSSSDINLVGNYLASKWGITWGNI